MIGGGHVVRCLALASALVSIGWRCAFACAKGVVETIPALAHSGHELLELENDEIDDPSALVRRWPAGTDLFVVDHYGLGHRFEARSRPWARQILVIDDRPSRRHDADALLDQTPGRQMSDYFGLLSSNCHLLLGPRFALLRPQFAAARAAALARRNTTCRLNRVLISLGAVDSTNVTAVVLGGVRATGLALDVDVVLGATAPHRVTLGERMAPRVRIHIDPDVDGLVDLMIQADVAVGAAGGSAWERCCLGLPSLVLVVADNQQTNADALRQAGAAAVVDPDSRDPMTTTKEMLRMLASEKGLLADMSRRAANICDGGGASRTANALNAVMNALPVG